LKGHENMQKDPAWYAQPPKAPHIIVADDETHSRTRRTLSHAFSEKALAQQEGLLQGYVDLLVNRLKEVTSKESVTQDLTKWYNWTTFDVIADLSFGEPFGCLQDLSTHKYIDLLFSSLQAFRLTYIMFYWPFAKRLRGMVVDQKVLAGRQEWYRWVGEKTQARVSRETQRPDFMTEILKHNGDKGQALSPDEMNSNVTVLLTAGSETTATVLSGVTYLLLKNPEVMQKLNDEIRGRFKNYNDITLEEVNKAPYLIATLQEALRYFPPVPTGFERRVGKGGEVVSGYYIPEDTALCVSSWPLAHSERNFKDPDAFIPERWMGDERFANDKRSAVQPFSFGPRNCLGKVSQLAIRPHHA
jgi:cytochrome P450